MIESISKTGQMFRVKIGDEFLFVLDHPDATFWPIVQAVISGGMPVDEESEPPIDPKWAGIEFSGVMCSATAADQNGLAAVLLAIQLQGEAFQPTRFYFENGNTLDITLQNWQAFAAVWLPFRQSFFTVD